MITDRGLRERGFKQTSYGDYLLELGLYDIGYFPHGFSVEGEQWAISGTDEVLEDTLVISLLGGVAFMKVSSEDEIDNALIDLWKAYSEGCKNVSLDNESPISINNPYWVKMKEKYMQMHLEQGEA